MSYMFFFCEKLKKLDLSGLDTGSVANMFGMFCGCESLKEFDFSGWDTANVEDMSCMFDECSSLTTLDLSGWNTGKVASMDGMFNCCSSLKNLDISSWDTGNVCSMSWMFLSCESLTSLDLSDWDTSDLFLIEEMFFGCTNLSCAITFSEAMDEEEYYEDCFEEAATADNAKITVNYSGNCTKAMAQSIVDTKSSSSHVVLGNGVSAIAAVAATASNTTAGVTLKWKQAAGADGYYVYRKTGTGSYSRIKSITSNSTTSYIDTTAASGSKYTYYVCAYKGTKTGSYTETSILYLSAVVKDDMTLSNTTTGVKIGWKAVTGAKGYNIYRRTSSETKYTKIDSVTGGTTVTYTDATAVSGTAYVYSVRAYSGTTLGSYLGKGCTYLAPVMKDDMTLANTTAGVKVSWKKITGAEGYYIYRRTTSGSYAQIDKVTSGSTLTYTDKKAVSGTAYVYAVRAFKGTTMGSYLGKGWTYLAPVMKDDMTLTNISTGVKVGWKKITGASGYYVYRRTASGTYSKIGTVTSGSTVTYTDKTAANGTNYIYAVRAYKSTTMGSYLGKGTVRLTTPAISSLTNVTGRKMTVKWGKNTKATGYQIQYCTSSSFPSASTKSVSVTSASTVSKTISSLTKSKTYYVRVRSYKTLSSTTYYSGWSATKSVKITK